jgi:hypothetical protein
MITATLTDDNGTITLPDIEQQFLATPLGITVDVETLDFTLYTDFTAKKNEWSFSYDHMTEDEYNDIRAKYDAQFTLNDYPLLSIPFYSLSNKPVRMYINEKDVWNHCGDVQNVVLRFREKN